MLKLYEFKCRSKSCGNKFDELVRGNPESIPCPACKEAAERIISPVKGWLRSPERTAMQLKRRSQEQTARCLKKGIPLDDPGSLTVNSDPVWRNKIRAKNTSRLTLDQHTHDARKYQDSGPGISPVAEVPFGSFMPEPSQADKIKIYKP